MHHRVHVRPRRTQTRRRPFEITDPRIQAKRLLPMARAAGYQGSARNFRRVVTEQKV